MDWRNGALKPFLSSSSPLFSLNAFSSLHTTWHTSKHLPFKGFRKRRKTHKCSLLSTSCERPWDVPGNQTTARKVQPCFGQSSAAESELMLFMVWVETWINANVDQRHHAGFPLVFFFIIAISINSVWGGICKMLKEEGREVSEENVVCVYMAHLRTCEMTYSKFHAVAALVYTSWVTASA